MQMTIKTIKGATIALKIDTRGNVSADINGKPHTLTAKVDGEFIILSGNLRAQMQQHDIAQVTDFFAKASKVQKAWSEKTITEYKNSAESFHDQMEIRMNDRNSNY